MHERSSRRLRRPALLALTGLALAALVAVLLPGPAPARSGFPRYGAHNDVSTPFNLTHLPTLTRTRFDGGDLRLGRTLWETPGHRRQVITYHSAGRRVSGAISIPRAEGRHPVVVMAHGYADPAHYVVGGSMEREQAYLADAGYVVVLTDYRNHGASGREPRGRTVRRPRGYAEDLINLVRAVRAARLPYADTSRVAVFGRSMGGGVALNAMAARPDLAEALVLSSPVSADAAVNYRHFVATRWDHERLETRIRASFGSPRTRPSFWRQASSASYLHRVRVPVQIHHGLADATTQPSWSRRTATILAGHGTDVDLRLYAGEGHGYAAAWPRYMRSIRTFLDTHIGRA